MPTIKMSKMKVIGRVIKELEESVENLKTLSDKEKDLVPDKFLKKLHQSSEFLNTITDMLKDMDYVQE